MKRPTKVVTFRGRFIGIAVLVVVQFIVGIIHVIFGFALLSGSFSVASYSMMPMVYTFYTLAYGLLVVFFTYLFWKERRLGWIGTVAVSLFVIIVDTLALFDLINVLGIPKTAGLGEIPYSLFILFYLFEDHIRLKYSI